MDQYVHVQLTLRFIINRGGQIKWGGFKDFEKLLKGYSSGQSHFSEINVKLAEKNKYATHSVTEVPL